MPDKTNLNNRARYAVLAMIEIARAPRAITVSTISKNTGVSKSYLEQLLATLRDQNLVTATLGPGGGYSLARPPSAITIAEISDATRNWAPGAKKNGAASTPYPADPSQMLWDHVGKLMHIQLQNITLEDVISQRLGN